MLDLEQLEKELTWKTSRSSGPGGQHVNKTSTKVTLFWNPAKTLALQEEERERVTQRLSGKVNSEGLVWISCSETRSQIKNKNRAFEKLINLLKKALHIPVPRKASKPSKSAVEQRIKDKKERAKIKLFRKNINLKMD